jgi:2-amino-4-hydroxy-6-hydroxymethyldihydropteridine diphosphokinase
MGRERRVPKGPRLIDMDILLYGADIVREPRLEIPHPRMAERKFVLVPLAEIAAEVSHPVSMMTIAEMLEATPDQTEVRKWRGKIPTTGERKS